MMSGVDSRWVWDGSHDAVVCWMRRGKERAKHEPRAENKVKTNANYARSGDGEEVQYN
jgi:hypothetical protein